MAEEEALRALTMAASELSEGRLAEAPRSLGLTGCLRCMEGCSAWDGDLSSRLRL